MGILKLEDCRYRARFQTRAVTVCSVIENWCSQGWDLTPCDSDGVRRVSNFLNLTTLHCLDSFRLTRDLFLKRQVFLNTDMGCNSTTDIKFTVK
jgi:hypothetical protein